MTALSLKLVPLSHGAVYTEKARHCERSEAIHGSIVGLLSRGSRPPRNDDALPRFCISAGRSPETTEILLKTPVCLLLAERVWHYWHK